MAEQVGFVYGSKLAASMAVGEGQRSFRSALRAVADALTAHGFAAHAEARGQSLALVKEACPFFDAAVQHPVICAVDRGMVRGMLDALVWPRHGAGGIVVSSNGGRNLRHMPPRRGLNQPRQVCDKIGPVPRAGDTER